MTNYSPTCEAPSSGPDRARGGWAARLVLFAINLHQSAHAGRPSPCRFYPSCSAYAREAIELHGARRGTWLAVVRLAKCRPFGPKGVDLVPTTTSERPS